jgi:hypothetical protein
MREFIRYNWVWVLLVLVAFGFLLLILLTTETKEVDGVVYEHVVTANGHGQNRYVTIIKTDDGYIEEERGLKLYTTPVGSRVTIEVTRTKKSRD